MYYSPISVSTCASNHGAGILRRIFIIWKSINIKLKRLHGLGYTQLLHIRCWSIHSGQGSLLCILWAQPLLAHQARCETSAHRRRLNLAGLCAGLLLLQHLCAFCWAGTVQRGSGLSFMPAWGRAKYGSVSTWEIKGLPPPAPEELQRTEPHGVPRSRWKGSPVFWCTSLYPGPSEFERDLDHLHSLGLI